GEGRFSAGILRPGRYAFGLAGEVVAELAAGLAGADWCAALGEALVRERTWHAGRRCMLGVRLGAGDMFHVSAAANRDSIRQYGLDWTRMGAAPGVAGSREPELAAVFLCDSSFDVGFHLRMARVPSDVWAVDVTGFWLETGPHGWLIAPRTIPAARLRLLES